MSSGMFRGKESSNRIELSRLVQELLNFGVLGSLQLWGWGDGWMGWGWLEGAPTHMHMHMHVCMHMHAHACMVNMIISYKWLPLLDLGKSLGFPMMSIHTCAFMCTCVGGISLTSPTPIHPPPSPRGDPRISQNSQSIV